METCLSIYVTFEGLGFCCFNPVRGGAEIAFLRLPDHELKIKITGTDNRNEILRNIAGDSKIELTSRGTAVENFRLNNEGEFQRRRGLENDLQDLRWLVDFEGDELHGRAAKPRKSEKPGEQIADGVSGLTEMFLPNAYFFTEQILLTEYDLEEINDATSARKTKTSGLFGGSLGAKVDAAEAALRIDGKNVFQFDEGVDPKMVARFFVTVTNICEPVVRRKAPPQSDFYKYYEVLDFEDGVRHDFRVSGKSLLYPRPAMCEFAWLSKTESLEEFFRDFPV